MPQPTAAKAQETAEQEFGTGGLAREGGEGWRPKAGDVLIGNVTDIGARWSDWLGAFYPVITVQPDDGDPVAFHAFHTVAYRRVLALRPQEGERIGIKYHGEVENADGKTKSNIYTIRVQRESGTGPDPYAGFKAPGGKEAKAADRTATAQEADDLPF